MSPPKQKKSKQVSSKQPAAAGTSVPCKIIVDKTGQFEFQVKSTDMPVKIKLCEDNKGNPATTSSFNTIQVYNAWTNPPQLVAGQPTGATATDCSLSLPPGAYDIVFVLNHLPSSQISYVYESCGGLNQLVRIPVLIQPSGYFSLKVV